MTSVNKLEKAVVFQDNIWKFVVGERQLDQSFVFINNGQMSVISDGYYRVLSKSTTEQDGYNEAVRLNVYVLSKIKRLRRL